MKSGYFIVLIFFLILPISGCFFNYSHEANLDPFIGKWLFVGSVHQEAALYDSLAYLYLYADSTFSCEFSYFMNEDSVQGAQAIEGRWYPRTEATYRDNFYVNIHIQISGKRKVWRADIFKEESKTTMYWSTDYYGFDREYFWVLEK